MDVTIVCCRFDIMNFVRDTDSDSFRFATIGKWDRTNKLQMNGKTIQWHGGGTCTPQGIQDPCRQTLQVLVPKTFEPYVHLQINGKGNDRFAGWLVDLFKYMATGCFDSNNYVYTQWNGTWDGMLTELKNHYSKYDMALAPIAMTRDRMSGVYFTRNVRTVSYGSAVLKYRVTANGLWQFFSPFQWDVWVTIVVFFFISGFVIHVLERKREPYSEGAPGIGDSIFVSFSMITYTQDQDSVLSTIGRIYVVVVCFIVLILTSCFTANLTVFLLQGNSYPTFSSVNDLAAMTVGSVSHTGYDDYLRYESFPRFKDVRSFTCINDGIVALKNGTIHGFMDDVAVLSQYERTDRDCQVAVIGNNWKRINTAFALRKSALHEYYLKYFNEKILTAWDTGYLDDLEQRYFDSPVQFCSKDGLGGDTQSLDMNNIGGVFILFAAVTGFCLVGTLVRNVMYKTGIWKFDVSKSLPGSHATAQLINKTLGITDDVKGQNESSGPSGSSSILGLEQVGQSTNITRFRKEICSRKISNGLSVSIRHKPVRLPPIVGVGNLNVGAPRPPFTNQDLDSIAARRASTASV